MGMGFADFLSDAGLSVLNSWLTTRSYIVGYAPSQADVASFKALTTAPDSAKYPHAARWYKHIASYTEDDDVDLFGSDDEEEDAEAERIRNERLAEYKKKKEGKTKPAAKSVVTMDVKPWDDETDMKELEASVRGIEKEGLVWGASKLVAVGFGIKKLQINLVIEDDKIGLSELQEEIEEFEDYVQSTDIVAMQKL